MRTLPEFNTPVLCHIDGRAAPIVLKLIENSENGANWAEWVDPDEYEFVERHQTEYYNVYYPVSWAPLPEYYNSLE